MTKQLLLSIIAIGALSLGACSTADTPMDTGQRISERGGEISDYGDSWSAGRRTVEQGSSMIDKSGKDAAKAEMALLRAREQVAKAEAQFSAAQADKANGEQLLADGRAQMRRAESNYAATRSGPPAAGNNPVD